MMPLRLKASPSQRAQPGPGHRVNVNGGAIALGHPIGCSATRIMVTLLYEMQKWEVAVGLAALCVGGGMGFAVIVEIGWYF